MSWAPPSDTVLKNILAGMTFDKNGLVAAIAQDENGVVLMLAWMNEEALRETLRSGRVCYWSRSRGKLWRKGESSGQHQHLLAAHMDCDRDAVLLTVRQTGVACHTGRRSCFYQEITPQGLHNSLEPEVDPNLLYNL